MIERLVTLRRVKWVAAFAPPLFLAVLEVLRRVVAPDFFNSVPGYLILIALVVSGSTAFSMAVFRYVELIQSRLQDQNRELLALHEAGLAVTSDLDIDAVLRRVVDEARELVGAQYGLLALVDENGEIREMMPSGMSQEVIDRLGPLPTEHGLISLIHKDGRTMRLDDVRQHPESRGFPEGHPEMRSMLGVPIVSRGHILGSLVLTEQESRGRFDANDQARLERFATQAAVAIENARLHAQVYALAVIEERERIAREMHDSLAQVLGYVNTKAQAVGELLQAGRTERAEQHLEQLATAAREAYTDVRENILGLRMTATDERDFLTTLENYIALWEDQSGIAIECDIHDEAVIASNIADLTALQTLRIVQETLTNVRKHAHATQVRMALCAQDSTLAVTIQDNGVGFDPETLERTGLPRFGLTIMRERALSIGGALTIERAQPHGTRVVLTVPLDEAGIPAQEEGAA